MAFFAVTIETIATANRHANADRLDVCTLEGMAFQFVTKRDEYRPGDRVVYFPLDSVLPPAVLGALKLEGRLAGPGKNRVKTVRLRGEVSQGLVGPLTLLEGLAESERTPQGITSFLGVTKYEPPVIFDNQARLVPLPAGLPAYDIEGADRFQAALTAMLELEVAVSEKLEGMNFSVSYAHGQVWVNQRNHSIEVVEGAAHSFWKVAERQGLIDLARTLSQEHGDDATVYGEFLGPRVQSNIYQLADHAAYLFDIRIGNRFLPVASFLETLARHGVRQVVPQLAMGVRLADWLAGRSIQAASEGRSVLADTEREGIVIRPMDERFSPELGGRLILKQRSPGYLAQSEA